MDAPPNIQIIHDAQGKPAFVVIPYADYVSDRGADRGWVPNEVAHRLLVEGLSPARAWREHLNLTQKEVADRIGISQPGYAEIENGKGKMRKATRVKVAAALGITPGQLDVIA